MILETTQHIFGDGRKTIKRKLTVQIPHGTYGDYLLAQISALVAECDRAMREEYAKA